MTLYPNIRSRTLPRASTRGLLPALLCTMVLGGCVTQEVRIVDMRPPDQYQGVQAEEVLLDIGVAVFDPNVPEDYDERIEQIVQPEVRRAEANYMPYFAKNMLQSTGNWGAVRVLPRPTDAVDVTVNGKILHSDGESMELEVAVADATGKQWFTRTYTALASKYSYGDSMPPNVDPFQSIYKELANDMLEYRSAMSDAQIKAIRTVAEMKFARSFAPDAFGNHVVASNDERFSVERLPAADDPMLSRVRKIREREYLFIDTLDEYYDNFYRSMYTPYQNWRKATFDEAIKLKQLRAEARNRTIGGAMAIIGGVAAIYESDNAFVDASGVVSVMSGALTIKSAIGQRAEAAISADILRELGTATEAEVVPHTLELENRTVSLQGNVDEQYDELRGILRRLYFEDLGLPVPPDVQAVEDAVNVVDVADSDNVASESVTQ
ncbi:MAG: hypothetical protein AB8B93_01565 [Pseudomonadales bacterium]